MKGLSLRRMCFFLLNRNFLSTGFSNMSFEMDCPSFSMSFLLPSSLPSFLPSSLPPFLPSCLYFIYATTPPLSLAYFIASIFLPFFHLTTFIIMLFKKNNIKITHNRKRKFKGFKEEAR